MAAGPGLTAQFIADATIAQNYTRMASFIHPDVLRYVTRAQDAAAARQADRDGYSTLRWKVTSVTIVPSWRFPGCSGQGIETYRHVAVVAYTELDSAPGGDSTSRHGAEHLVRNKHGIWNYFPIVGACT